MFDSAVTEDLGCVITHTTAYIKRFLSPGKKIHLQQTCTRPPFQGKKYCKE